MNMIRILSRQKKGLQICHINAQSLKNKLDEFRLIFENSNIDIICVSETWLKPETPDSLISLKGYKVFRADRVTHAGGVAIFVKDRISCKFCCKSGEVDAIEYLFLEIKSTNSNLLIGCVYRPNNKIKFDSFLSIMESLTVSYSNVVLAGDFNSNILLNCSLVEHMSSLGLFLNNLTNPTHFTPTSSTLLDLFFVDSLNKILIYDQLSAPCFSKHDLLFLVYEFEYKSEIIRFSYRDFRNFNYPLLDELSRSINWSNIYYITPVDEKLMFLESCLRWLFDQTVPIRTKCSVGNSKPWFSTSIKNSISERDFAYSRWKRFRTSELYEVYRQQRRKVNNMIRSAKRQYYRERFSSAAGSKKTWNVIKDIGIGRFHAANTCSENADSLNKIFTVTSVPDVSVRSDYILNTVNANISTTNSFEFSCVSEYDVMSCIKSIKSNAIGFDDMDPRFVRIILPLILPYLTHLLNFIITTSTFPSSWKYSKVIPVPKNNSDFRPISILCFLSKVLEKILHRQIIGYIDETNLLYQKQSGFRSEHSCITALVEVAENLRNNLDDGKTNFLVLLDHSKAFDTVDHNLLCLKLKHFFNFSTSSCSLMRSYLYNRCQSVCTATSISGILRVNRGVPQGSVLGPLLFSIYVNDLPTQISNCDIHLYADDVQIYLKTPEKCISNNISKLNEDLDKIHLWAVSNGLCLNPKKSKCIVIHNRSQNPVISSDIKINDQKIDIINSAKNLGVLFNNTLTWKNHINLVIGQTYSKLRILWSTQFLLPLNIRILLAKTYLIPGLLYGCELFANCDSASRRKLNVIYNNIIRYVYGLDRFGHVSPFSVKLYGVSFENLLNCRVLCLLHKVIYSKSPKYLYCKLKFARSNRGCKLIPFRHRYLVSEWQFFIHGIRLWNLLPSNIQTIRNALNFKRTIFQYFAES